MTDTTADPVKEPTTFQVREFIDAKKLKEDLAFNDQDLTTAMMQQSSLFSYYGVLAAEAARQVDVVKLLLENTEAAIYQLERNKAATAGEKLTEAMLEKRVARNSRVIGMKKALNEAKRIEAIGKTAVEAFRHRRDMLVQMGLISREEMKGELRIQEKNIRESAYEYQKDSVLERMGRKPSDDA